MKNETPSSVTLRLDKWLWFARIARTRSLAARLVSDGCVQLGGRGAAKPHHAVRIGDVIVLELAQQRRRLIVRALGTRRGPPAEARLLYVEPSPPVRPEMPAAEWVSLFADGVPADT